MKILLVIPSIDGRITCETFRSLWGAARDPGLLLETRALVWNQDVCRVRNRAAYEFMRSDADVLWFVDADVGFDADVPRALLASGLELVAGAYPKKKIRWGESRSRMTEWPFQAAPGCDPEILAGRPFHRCTLIPMGCTMIRRSVFMAIDDAATIAGTQLETYVDTYDGADHDVRDYFGHMTITQPNGKKAKLPEDYSFCVRASLAGVVPWTLLDPVCTHTGGYTFNAREIGR